MNLNLFTDDVDPDHEDGPRFVKIAPGTLDQQLSALESRLAAIDLWIDRMVNSGDTHSYARYAALCQQRDRVAENLEFVNAVIATQTPDPEPPNADLGWRWQVMDAIDADEERRFGKAGDK